MKLSPGISKTYRMATSSLRQLPDFLIIGVVKGGTTSLYKYVCQNPAVAPATRKEVHFFGDSAFLKPKKTLSWYRSHFPIDRKLLNSTKITGEASPEYFHAQGAPQRIKEIIPNTKLILLLRNPIDRAYSHYQMKIKLKTNENRKIFEEICDYEASVLKDIFDTIRKGKQDFIRAPKNVNYLSSGVYIFSLKRWLAVFPREQLLIVPSENLFENPSKTVKSIFDFLEVPDDEDFKYQVYNRGSYSNLSPALRERMSKFFAPYNQDLYEYLGQDFHWD